MNYFLDLVEKHKFMYIIIISLIATILIINSTLEFAERVINNLALLLVSLLVFYFLVHIAINEEVKKKKWIKEEQ